MFLELSIATDIFVDKHINKHYRFQIKMPSDAKKKREQKKKEAAKAKQSGKKVETKEEVRYFFLFLCHVNWLSTACCYI